jgi:hypothetical protein
MTKAKARERAKAKAGQKVKKREAAADQPDQNIRPGKFDPGANMKKASGGNPSARTQSGARRGAARSR